MHQSIESAKVLAQTSTMSSGTCAICESPLEVSGQYCAFCGDILDGISNPLEELAMCRLEVDGKRKTYNEIVVDDTLLYSAVRTFVHQAEQSQPVVRYLRFIAYTIVRLRELHTPRIPQHVGELDDAQAMAVNCALKGQSMFIAGGAGVGKSYVLKKIILELSKKYGKDKVLVTAPTWTAALLIEGVSIHRGFVLNPMLPTDAVWNGVSDSLFDQTVSNDEVRSERRLGKIADVQLFVIDEISMVSGDLFSRIVKKIELSTGKSIDKTQLIVCGDFAQLEPVDGAGKMKARFKYAFQSPDWMRLYHPTANEKRVFHLHTCHRQSDMEMIAALAELRHGKLNPLLEDRIISKEEAEKLFSSPEDETVYIAYTNAVCESKNACMLAKLPGEATTIKSAVWLCDPSVKVVKELLPEVQLKVGAKVILTSTVCADAGFTNGTVCIVESIDTVAEDRLSKFPLLEICHQKLAEQGENLEFNRVFGEVPASHVIPLFIKSSEPYGFPSVRVRSIKTGKTYTVTPIIEKLVEKNHILCAGVHIPLILGWARTGHRCQGSSLDKVVVDTAGMSGVHGLAYIAASRARTLEGLKFVGPPLRNIKVDRVIEEYLTSIE